MFHIYDTHEGKLQPVNEPLALVAEARWIDLLRPTPEDEEQINRWLGVEIPDREEMEEIEISSRLYIEGGVCGRGRNPTLRIWASDIPRLD